MFFRRRQRYQMIEVLKNNQFISDEVSSIAVKKIFKVDVSLKGVPVDDIWGSDVMIFNYYLKINDDDKKDDLTIIKELFQTELNEYSDIHQLFWRGKPALIISDIWSRDGLLAWDVAYVINQSTENYLVDLGKSENFFE